MKRVIVAGLCLLAGVFLLPVLLVDARDTDTAILPPQPSPAQVQNAGQDKRSEVQVLMEDGSIEKMALEEYLWSVTAAEMPASFELEALKAQAVTARTYTVWKMERGESNHPGADVCTDVSCCQAFITREQTEALWGEGADGYAEKITAAVEQTDGEIMTYQGKPIQAVFFASSIERTEDAVEVWGNAVPYLVSVDSPEGAEVPNYHTQVDFTPEEFKEIFLARYPGADLSGSPAEWIKNETRTASGRVASMDVGGITMKGTELRELFGLRSTGFTAEGDENGISFQVTGYGHGVGMSQYGANTLAAQGKTCREILSWYYTGIQIGTY